jgi:hypothetical protein
MVETRSTSFGREAVDIKKTPCNYAEYKGFKYMGYRNKICISIVLGGYKGG